MNWKETLTLGKAPGWVGLNSGCQAYLGALNASAQSVIAKGNKGHVNSTARLPCKRNNTLGLVRLLWISIAG
jgi:uncharacterized protein YigA (DUF484 family)